MDFADNDPAAFIALLRDFDAAKLDESDETVYGLWPDLTFAYFNNGWRRFARDNGGEPAISENWSPGRCVLDAIPEPLKPFFQVNFAKCLRENRPWEHRYECSSVELIRMYHMLTFPLGDVAGLLVINSLRHEATNTYPSCPPLEPLYRNEHGILTQCCHCRRVLRIGTERRWDWVSDWIDKRPKRISDGLCQPCMGFHYSPQRLDDTQFAQAFHTPEH